MSNFDFDLERFGISNHPSISVRDARLSVPLDALAHSILHVVHITGSVASTPVTSLAGMRHSPPKRPGILLAFILPSLIPPPQSPGGYAQDLRCFPQTQKSLHSYP
jgi:hypothetical protein